MVKANKDTKDTKETKVSKGKKKATKSKAKAKVSKVAQGSSVPVPVSVSSPKEAAADENTLQQDPKDYHHEDSSHPSDLDVMSVGGSVGGSAMGGDSEDSDSEIPCGQDPKPSTSGAGKASKKTSSFKWTQSNMNLDDEVKIANFYEGHRMFWDMSHYNNKNKPLKEATLGAFAKEMGMDREYLYIICMFVFVCL